MIIFLNVLKFTNLSYTQIKNFRKAHGSPGDISAK